MSRSVPPDVVVHYPCSDDQPMAESEFQLVPMLYVLTVLRTHFRDREDVYVGGDMFVYYEEGNPRAVVAPDVFVVIGAAKRAEHPRDTYKLWEEPKGPDFVLEMLSSSTWETDLGPKRALYASLGVAEYWLFDPTREHLLSPPLRGMRLVGGRYRDLPVVASGGGTPRPFEAKCSGSTCAWTEVRFAFAIRLPEGISSAMRSRRCGSGGRWPPEKPPRRRLPR